RRRRGRGRAHPRGARRAQGPRRRDPAHLRRARRVARVVRPRGRALPRQAARDPGQRRSVAPARGDRGAHGGGGMTLQRLLPAVWAIGIALLCASVLIVCVGGAPLEVYRLLVSGTWGHAYGIGQVLFKTTPLVFTGLSVAIALRAGLFN